MPTPVTHPLIRFQRLATVEADGCWLWQGALNNMGYGKFWFEGRLTGAHRAAFTMFRGPIPKWRDLDHLCRVRRCVNPFHLEPVTRQVNTLRGVGPAAVNAAKTHCKRGHELSGDNLYVCPKGKRRCRTCWRRSMAEYEARNPGRKRAYQ